MEILAYKMTLISAKLRILRAVNEALSKRRRAKKNRIRQGGALTIEDIYDILAQEEVDEQIRRNKRSRGGRQNEGQLSARRYGNCGKTSHNARTC